MGRDRNSRRLQRLINVHLLAAAAGISLSGCAPIGDTVYGKDNKTRPVDYDKLAESMDGVAQKLEQFGSVSVSSPMLAPVDTAGFEFNITKTADGFYNDARTDVSGRAAAAFSSAEQTGLGVSVSADIGATIDALRQASQNDQEADAQKRSVTQTARLAAIARLEETPKDASTADKAQARYEAKQAYDKTFIHAGYTTPTTAPAAIDPASLPTIPDGLAPTADTAAAKLAALPALMKLLGDNAPVVLENDDALMKAGRDNALKGLLGMLGEPKRMAFADKKIMLGVAMVAVEPGWQTRRGYAADVSVLCSYDYIPARDERVKEFVNAAIKAATTKDDCTLRELGKIANDGSETIDKLFERYQVAQGWGRALSLAKSLTTVVNNDRQAAFIKRARQIEEREARTPSLPVQSVITKLDAIDRAQSLAESVRSASDSISVATAILSDPMVEAGPLEPPDAKVLKQLYDLQTIIGSGFTNDELTKAEPLSVPDAAIEPQTRPTLPGRIKSNGEGFKSFDRFYDGKGVYVARPLSNTVDYSNPGGDAHGTVATTFRLNTGRPAERANPTVAAVSPMVDSDTLDLSSSVRQTREHALNIAIALQYLGVKGAFDFYNKYAEQLDRDVMTRSVLPTMNVYSHSGGMFGFQIGPRLKGLDVTLLNKKNSDVAKTTLELDRQSFPVLVLIGMDDRDLQLRFGMYKGKYSLLEPAIKFSQSSRWVPLNGSGGIAGRWSEQDRLYAAAQVTTHLQTLPPSQNSLDEMWEASEKARVAIVSAVKTTSGKCAAADASCPASTTDANSTLPYSFPATGVNVQSLYWARNFLLAARNGGELAEGELNAVKSFAATVQSLQLDSKGCNWNAAEAIKPDVCSVLSRVVQARASQGARPIDDYVRDRASMLSYQAFGSSNSQDIPLRVVLPPTAAPAAPTISRVEPAIIMLSAGTSSQVGFAEPAADGKKKDEPKQTGSTDAKKRGGTTAPTTQPTTITTTQTSQPTTPATEVVASTKPSIAAANPSQASGIASLNVLLVGSNLKSVNEAKLVIRSSSTSGGAVLTGKAVKVGDGAIAITFDFAAQAPSSVWFEVPYTIDGETKSLITQPVQVLPATAPLKIHFEDGTKVRDLTAPSNAPADIVKAVVGEGAKKDPTGTVSETGQSKGKESVDMKLKMDLKASQDTGDAGKTVPAQPKSPGSN